LHNSAFQSLWLS